MSDQLATARPNGHSGSDLAVDEQLKTYATLTVRLAKELEAIGRQLSNVSGRIHAVNAELTELRGQLKAQGRERAVDLVQ